MKNLMRLFLLVGLLNSCEKNEGNPTEIKQLGYGTSFGMCVGYCRNDMLLKSGAVIYSRSGWNNQVEPVSCNENLTAISWDAFKKTLDLNKFYKLPEVIGCPDCADGGAEWVEVVKFSGDNHKITFEYGNAPEELKEIVEALRGQNEKSVHCGEF